MFVRKLYGILAKRV